MSSKLENKRIDYVLVLDKNVLEAEEETQSLNTFINVLKERGLEIELTNGTVYEVVFVKIHLTQRALNHFAKVYNFDIWNYGHVRIPGFHIKWKWFNTDLTIKNDDLFERAAGSLFVIWLNDKRATNAERIMILNEILETSKFGFQLFGLKHLIRLGFIKTAYPLHDGSLKVDAANQAVNDRQILFEYWANFRLWYTEQPLNLIEKYYGTEVAFYFAWLGYYNFMLIFATFIGLLCFFGSLIHLNTQDVNIINEICNSDQIICPVCYKADKCRYVALSDSCFYSKLTCLFDNYSTVFFAVFMSFWATLFLNLWKRRENMLKIRWNVKMTDFDVSMRYGFHQNTSQRRFNPVTNRLEPYMPDSLKIKYFTLTGFICSLSVFIVLVVMYGIVTYRITFVAVLKSSNSDLLRTHATFLTMCTGSILQVIFIKIFSKFYGKLSLWLTTLENPRTQTEFDKSMIYKRFFLDFTNNYSPLFYIAFLKGLFFTTPNHLGLIVNDICEPAGCISSLCIQLAFVMVLKSLVGNIITLFMPKIIKLFRMKNKNRVELSQWEQEYEMKPTDRYFLISEQLSMIIQYGFVTLFVTAFPLAPLCALLNNIIELRLDAYKLIRYHQRPVPRKVQGIGPFNGILKGLTYLSTVTNAFVWGFTSDFVAREIYKYQVDSSLKGFINSTLSSTTNKSVFDPHNFDSSTKRLLRYHKQNLTVCYYRGNRYPPNHSRKYQLTTSYWYETGIRLICVLIFEHLVFVFNGILSYSICDIPRYVKKYLNHQRQLQNQLNQQATTSNKSK